MSQRQQNTNTNANANANTNAKTNATSNKNTKRAYWKKSTNESNSFQKNGSSRPPFKRTHSNPSAPQAKRPKPSKNFDSDEDVLREAKLRANLKWYNKLITENAKRKQTPLAVSLFKQLKEQGLKPDIYTYTCVVNALVRGGLLKDALKIVQEMKDNGIPPNTVTYTAIIKGFTTGGNVKEAVQIMNDMESGENVPNLRTYNTVLRGCVQVGDYVEAQNIMDKLAQHNLQKDHSTVLSLLKLYVQQMKIKEAWSSFQELQHFLITIEPTIYTLLATGAALAKEETIAQKVLEKLTKRNDLTPLVLREIETIKSYKSNSVPDPNKTDRLYRWSEGTPLNWRAIPFQHPKGPINMEICSGLGEWVINRCKKEQDKNWISLEQRYDRVLQTWSKMELQKISNLFVCCGDASTILKQDCFKNKLDAIFVNFPDPPHHEDNNRLFNADFIKLIHQVLKSQGTIEVLTDDHHYSNIISKEFTSSNLFNTHTPQNSNDPTYFDELEKSVGRTERYAIAFKKKN